MNDEFHLALEASRPLRLRFPKSQLQEAPELVLRYYSGLIRMADSSTITPRQACLLIGATYWYKCAKYEKGIEDIALEAGRICSLERSDLLRIDEGWRFLKFWVSQTAA